MSYHLIRHLLAAMLLPLGTVGAETATSLSLARELTQGAEHAEAALEFRRLAIENDSPPERGVFYWMAGYNYMHAHRFDQADLMLSRTEDATQDLQTEVYLLRAEQSLKQRRWDEAAFYWENVAASPEAASEPITLSVRHLAAMRLRERNFEGAASLLKEHDLANDEAMAAITQYRRGRDKSPKIGGMMGLIPGLGYAYSGEFANALRSIILNGLCIWGISEFSEDEQWGAVALVGFAEITFYSGSIYGGIDAAVRYNEHRLQHATRAITGQASFAPDLDVLPVLKLNFDF